MYPCLPVYMTWCRCRRLDEYRPAQRTGVVCSEPHQNALAAENVAAAGDFKNLHGWVVVGKVIEADVAQIVSGGDFSEAVVEEVLEGRKRRVGLRRRHCVW